MRAASIALSTLLVLAAATHEAARASPDGPASVGPTEPRDSGPYCRAPGGDFDRLNRSVLTFGISIANERTTTANLAFWPVSAVTKRNDVLVRFRVRQRVRGLSGLGSFDTVRESPPAGVNVGSSRVLWGLPASLSSI